MKSLAGNSLYWENYLFCLKQEYAWKEQTHVLIMNMFSIIQTFQHYHSVEILGYSPAFKNASKSAKVLAWKYDRKYHQAEWKIKEQYMLLNITGSALKNIQKSYSSKSNDMMLFIYLFFYLCVSI